MVIREASFVTSCARPEEFPPPRWPEVAFAGRSNVGKSSLMNLLLGRKHLVKISAAPGKTQTINWFSVNQRLYFVDLPGYGYARVPDSIRSSWKTLIERYLGEREVLRGVVLVLDPRRSPTPLDVQMRVWLDAYHIPIVYALTKADQVSRQSRSTAAGLVREGLQIPEGHDPCFVSAKTGEGKAQLWARLDRLALA